MQKETKRQRVEEKNYEILLYFAGAYEEKEEIKQFSHQVISAIPRSRWTYDWPSQEKRSYAQLDYQRIADAEIQAVKDCDVFILYLTEKNHTRRGSSTELGIALGLNKYILVYAPSSIAIKTYKNIFLRAKHPECIIVSTVDTIIKNIEHKFGLIAKSNWKQCPRKECLEDWIEMTNNSTQERQDAEYLNGSCGYQHCELVNCHTLYWRGKNGSQCERCLIQACEFCSSHQGKWSSEDEWVCPNCLIKLIP